MIAGILPGWLRGTLHLNRSVVDELARDVIGACDYLKEHVGTAKPPELHKHSSPKC